MEENQTQKKTAATILIERFLQDVDETGTLPWQRPYQTFNAFNWVTMKQYRGFNRLILPFGEYLTERQINQINKEQKEDYRFVKGIKWYPIAFFTPEERKVSKQDILEISSGMDCDINAEGYLFTHEFWVYFRREGEYFKKRNILKYYRVADRKYFVNSKGECLPSRIESGEVIITYSEPKKAIDDYVERSGIDIDYEYTDVPCYVPSLDKVFLNPYSLNQEEWFSTAFHELAHSTGAMHRLNREGVSKRAEAGTPEAKKSKIAVEECIAEICSSLCCAECGISTFSTSESRSYENSVAYVKNWKKRIMDWGKEFIYIVSQAEKAFNYIFDEEI